MSVEKLDYGFESYLEDRGIHLVRYYDGRIFAVTDKELNEVKFKEIRDVIDKGYIPIGPGKNEIKRDKLNIVNKMLWAFLGTVIVAMLAFGVLYGLRLYRLYRMCGE